MEWVFITFNWYIYLLIIGLIAYPFTRGFFRGFFDKGYPFAKIIAVLILSYLSFVLGIFKIVPFSQTSLTLMVLGFLGIHIFLNRKNKDLLPPLKWNRELVIILGEELLFIGSLLFLAFVRGQEPSIRGLEKFMDYGFINSILRSSYFPPLDIWYAGGNPINYYYFGHLTGAVLIKLSGTAPAFGYNLILATIFAQSVTSVFSLAGNIVFSFLHKIRCAVFGGLIGTLIVNLAGNLHTVYLFTKGYNTEAPAPFWEILGPYNPTKYWYPNATRFIPLTIHEFPSYSYVVADLHGHVFDIPFVLLTLALLFIFFLRYQSLPENLQNKKSSPVPFVIIFGFLTAVHYMTNAFDGPIYLLLTGLIFLVLFGLSGRLFTYLGILTGSFLIFSYPFSSHFTPFVSGIGLNCSPAALVSVGRFGPFLFEQGNCQPDPLWMLFILWGFFWICFGLFFAVKYFQQKSKIHTSSVHTAIDDFIFILFTFGTILILIPEFFYIKDIYPAHFRANTMFKLGYQAFIMMGIASSYVLFRIVILKKMERLVLACIYMFFFAFIMLYPFYSFPSYYGAFNKVPNLNGIDWLNSTFPEDKEIIDYLNKNVPGQVTILEAQGDSYTDFERISANTGLSTVAGWWVHEWLWRGSADVVGKRIPEIVALYESKDIEYTKDLIRKYDISYVIISKMERDKYKNLFEDKFGKIGKKVFTSSNGFGALYKVEKR